MKIMIFLIEYDRRASRIVSLQTFEESEHDEARKVRLKLELDLNRRGIDHEIVILEAASEDVLRKTHRRYFDSVDEIGKSFNETNPKTS